MNYYSTRNKNSAVSARQAVLLGLAPDGGLFMPQHIPQFPREVLFDQNSDIEILTRVLHPYFSEEFSLTTLSELLSDTISFGAPLHQLDPHTFVLELFHGPTAAFKDFGARCMARLVSHFCRDEDNLLTVLVATSGDTGGAVAAGFHKVPGVRVVVLYPSAQISPLQEKQLTTLGDNIHAFEIEGTFDDCQSLVKQSFLDRQLAEALHITSANSINIARLLPQSLYYILAARQLRQIAGHESAVPTFSVPSGNFGNLTGGLLAQRMGLPIQGFIAATNSNDVFPQYLMSGQFQPEPSKRTISNAMDVGNPSNFERITDLFDSSLDAIREVLVGQAFSDQETRRAIAEVAANHEYLLDPHGAVAFLGLRELHQQNHGPGILLATAHPAKFIEVMEEVVPGQTSMPKRLSDVLKLPKQARQLPACFETLKNHLMEL